MKVLEIGSTGKSSIFKQIINNPKITWYTLDISKEWIGPAEDDPFHVYSESEYNYPFNAETFDIVISGNVIEHVRELWSWVTEIKRITKSNGYIITIGPVSWDYHATPVDCWRIYPEGMKALMTQQGLRLIVNIFDSLEKSFIPASTPTIPGNSSVRMDRSFRKRIKAKLIFNKVIHAIPILRFFKIPLTTSYDNICVCIKP